MNIIFCCKCEKCVDARLTDGKEIYPHRVDLKSFPFWKCDDCGNFVGCHYKTKNKTKPLGCIPTPEIKKIRQELHSFVDPIWKNKQHSRKFVYKKISDFLGCDYHAAEVKSVEVGRSILNFVAVEFYKCDVMVGE